jgi:hypothetical protein
MDRLALPELLDLNDKVSEISEQEERELEKEKKRWHNK